MATFQKLADNWSELTVEQKESLFEGTSEASIEDLKTLGKFKILILKDENVPVTVSIGGIKKKNQVIKPKTLIDMFAFEHINSIAVGSTVADGGTVEVALTKDGTNYYIWGGSSWESVDLGTAATWMSTDTLATLSVTQYDLLLADAECFAIAFKLGQTAYNDTAVLTSFTITADMKASWAKAVHNTDYVYNYTNKTLIVKLLQAGTYKINYPVGNGFKDISTELSIATEEQIHQLTS